MDRKQLWLLIAGLVMLNCITVAFFLTKSQSAGSFVGKNETVASIGDTEVTREEWLAELEARHGQDVLQDMIDQKVIEKLAEKYKLKVSKEDLDREITLMQTMYASSMQGKQADDKKRRMQIKNSMLLEELLTKDVAVSKKEIAAYYEENQDLFNMPTSYHLSHIIVKTKKEADQTEKELEDGSSFSALAMERSIEEFSANQGGNIGFLNEEDERYPAEYISGAAKLTEGKWSKPIKVDQGYAIIKLHEKINGKKYKLREVKNQIRRQIALEQMDTPASPRTFWDEAKVEWFYGEKKDN